MIAFPDPQDIRQTQMLTLGAHKPPRPGGQRDHGCMLRRALIVRTVGREQLPVAGHWAAFMVVSGIHCAVSGSTFPAPPAKPSQEADLELRCYYVLHCIIGQASWLSAPMKNMLLASLKPGPTKKTGAWQSTFSMEWESNRTYLQYDRCASLGAVSQLTTGQVSKLWRQTVNANATHHEELRRLRGPMQQAARSVTCHLLSTSVAG